MYERFAQGLRSIYPSRGMRQLFDDVTMGQWRHNHTLFYTTNKMYGGVAIMARNFLILVTTLGQHAKCQCRGVFAFEWWTRQRIHNSLIVVDRYLRFMEDNTIPDSWNLIWNRFIPHSSQESRYSGLLSSYIGNVMGCWWTPCEATACNKTSRNIPVSVKMVCYLTISGLESKHLCG